MPLLENLLEGVGRAAGSDVSGIENAKQRRQQLEDYELQSKSDSILNDVKVLQQRRASLPADSPEIADIDKALTAHQQAFTDLFHPVRNPGAFQRLGRFLEKHIARKEPAPLPKSNAVTPERMAGLAASAAGTEQNPFVLKKRSLMAAGVPEEEATRLATGQKDQKEVPTKYLPATDVFTTTDKDGKNRYWRVPVEGAAEEVSFGGDTLVPKATAGGHSKFNEEAAIYEKRWGKKLADWTPEQLSFFNRKMAFDSQHAGSSTHISIQKDRDGNLVPVEETNTKNLGPEPKEDPSWVSGSTPTVPKTPGEAKKRVPKPSGGGSPHVKVGEPLPFKGLTPAYTDAKKKYDSAVALVTSADLVAQHPEDASNQKRLGIQLERLAAGRFTMQALDYLKKTGWTNTMDAWLHTPTTGALPANLMDQWVRAAHQELEGAKAALDAASGGSSGGSSDDEAIIKALGGK